MIPTDFSGWELVYYCFLKWDTIGPIEEVHDSIHGQIRQGRGKKLSLSFGLKDSQIVKSVSMIPSEKNDYLVEVILPSGMKTSYNKNIEYKPEMAGTAEIITKNLSVLNRIFYTFKNIIRRS